MRRLTFILCAIFLLCHATSDACAQGESGDRQFYSGWKKRKDGQGQYFKVYYFKVNPEDTSYHVQYVVWIPNKPDLAFYYNADGQYWCAAPVDKVDRWHVFDKKVAKISDVLLPKLQQPPPIPQTKGTRHEAAMLFPSFEGLPRE